MACDCFNVFIAEANFTNVLGLVICALVILIFQFQALIVTNLSISVL